MVFSADETCDVGNDFGSPVTYDYPATKKFSGEVNWVEIDLGKDSVNLDHLISPEDRLNLAMAHQSTPGPAAHGDCRSTFSTGEKSHNTHSDGPDSHPRRRYNSGMAPMHLEAFPLCRLPSCAAHGIPRVCVN